MHRWEFSVELPAGPDGKRRQVTKGGFRTQAEAAEERAKVLQQHRAGTLPDAERRRLTVGAYLADWLDGKVSTGRLRATTAKSYRQHVDDYLTPHLGTTRLVDLRPDHVEAMFRKVRAERAERGAPVMSATTEARILATLRNAVRAAARRGLIHTDPTAAVEISRGDGRKVDPWDWATFERFTAWLDGQDDATTAARLSPVVHLVARTGLRLGEVCGLRWEDVDLDAGLVVVRQQAQAIGGKVVYGPPKSRESTDRRVPLVPEAVAVLRAHRKRQIAERFAWGAAWEDSGLVFTRPGGAGLVPTTLSRAFGGAVKASGVRVCRFHDLRHLAATHMLRNGVPLVLVSRVLGHSSPAITGTIYNHVLADDAAEAMALAFAR
ncbi:site-specific integrase [Cellulosimicrobium cellulans]|uniref:site-specific integrase n=1 Tax=Cellulosimicrobium cellulans TaxID=1710 RepID=UPI001ED9FB31|nr:site-specific integrase [Cellulosimicrobium cellulans]UKJ63500.1 site-specific integrase [Cellulosimicrobium cellulans]